MAQRRIKQTKNTVFAILSKTLSGTDTREKMRELVKNNQRSFRKGKGYDDPCLGLQVLMTKVKVTHYQPHTPPLNFLPILRMGHLSPSLFTSPTEFRLLLPKMKTRERVIARIMKVTVIVKIRIDDIITVIIRILKKDAILTQSCSWSSSFSLS